MFLSIFWSNVRSMTAISAVLIWALHRTNPSTIFQPSLEAQSNGSQDARRFWRGIPKKRACCKVATESSCAEWWIIGISVSHNPSRGLWVLEDSSWIIWVWVWVPFILVWHLHQLRVSSNSTLMINTFHYQTGSLSEVYSNDFLKRSLCVKRGTYQGTAAEPVPFTKPLEISTPACPSTSFCSLTGSSGHSPAIASRRWSSSTCLKCFETFWNHHRCETLKKSQKFVTIDYVFFLAFFSQFRYIFAHQPQPWNAFYLLHPGESKVSIWAPVNEKRQNHLAVLCRFMFFFFVPFFWTLFSLREKHNWKWCQINKFYQIHFQHLSTKVYNHSSTTFTQAKLKSKTCTAFRDDKVKNVNIEKG